MGPTVKSERKHNYQTVVLTADSTTSPDIPLGDLADAGFIISSVTTAATLTYFVGERPTSYNTGDGSKQSPTIGALKSSANAAITQAISSGAAYRFPVDCQPFGVVRLIVDTGNCTIVVSRKS